MYPDHVALRVGPKKTTLLNSRFYSFRFVIERGYLILRHRAARADIAPAPSNISPPNAFLAPTRLAVSRRQGGGTNITEVA